MDRSGLTKIVKSFWKIRDELEVIHQPEIVVPCLDHTRDDVIKFSVFSEMRTGVRDPLKINACGE
jgi:hypothetical protein